MTNPTFRIFGIDRMAAHLAEGEVILRGNSATVLALLLAAGTRGTPTDDLAAALYGDDPKKNVTAAVRMAVSRTRKGLSLEGDAILNSPYRIVLPSDQVDLWHLANLAADESAVVDEADLAWILAGEPYAKLPLPSSVVPSVQAAERDQRILALRFCFSEPASLTEHSCQLLADLVTRTPIDDQLAVVVAGCLHRAGRRVESLNLLRRFGDSFHEEMGLSSPLVTGLLEEVVAASPVLTRIEPPRRPSGQVPAQLLTDDEHCFGRQRELEQLAGHRGSILLGAGGAGKTHVLAALARQQVEAGNTVSYLAPETGRRGAAFTPFLAAFPPLRRVLAAVQRSPQEEGIPVGQSTAVESVWQALLSTLETYDADAVHYVLVDDAQWLDEASVALVRRLGWWTTDRSIVLVVAGINDDQFVEWLGLRTELERARLSRVDLSMLELDSLHAMVRTVHPEATFEAQRGLAVEVEKLTGGLPQPARLIIEASDPRTLVVPERIEAGTDLRWLLGRLDHGVRDVAVAAAVLGQVFSVSSLLALCDDEDLVERAIDALIELRLVEETDVFDRLAFRHGLIQRAIVWSARPHARFRLNVKAARLTDDVHVRATHLAQAGWAASTSETIAALRASALAYADDAQWRRVVERMRAIEFIDKDRLTTDDLIVFATASDLTGLSGSTMRAKAFKRAKAAGDERRAFLAAVSALPSAERPDGDQARLRLIEDIDAAGLPADDRFDHAVQLARQRALTGDAGGAEKAAAGALNMASTRSQIGRAHVAMWTARHHLAPTEHPIDDDLIAAVAAPVRMPLLQMRAISELEACRLADAERSHVRFRARAVASGDPLRIWHALVFDALLEFEHGRLSNYRAASAAAFEHATLHGLQEATSVLAGQLFHGHFAVGTHGELFHSYELIPANVRRSALARASYALSQAAAAEAEPSAGHEEAAVTSAMELVADALGCRRSLSIVVVALLAPLVVLGRDQAAGTGDRDGKAAAERLVESSKALMLEYTGRSIVVGFGVANMGPMERYLAPLASSAEEHRGWLVRAVEAADRLGSRSWRIVSRWDLARLSGDSAEADRWLLEAKELAVGTDFEDHVR